MGKTPVHGQTEDTGAAVTEVLCPDGEDIPGDIFLWLDSDSHNNHSDLGAVMLILHRAVLEVGTVWCRDQVAVMIGGGGLAHMYSDAQKFLSPTL